MPTKGQISTNIITGDSYEFLETAKDTTGERVTLKATIKSKGQYVPDHFHVFQDETFEIVSGKMTIKTEGKTTTLNAGEKITLPKNIPHNHFNNESEALVYIQTVRPALDFDYLVENLIGLASDGKSKNGKYGLMQELVTLKYLDSKAYLAEIPIGIQKFLMNTVAPVGRLLGYRAVYKKYSDMEK
jgi:quercetin dioxygenase-like cupin family protein